MWSWYGRTPRCLDEDKLFPASKPVLCEEKNANPFFEIKCCRSDYCNKFIRFDPKRGEIPVYTTNKSTNYKNPCANSSNTFVFGYYIKKKFQISSSNRSKLENSFVSLKIILILVLKYCIQTTTVNVFVHLNLHVGNSSHRSNLFRLNWGNMNRVTKKQKKKNHPFLFVWS